MKKLFCALIALMLLCGACFAEGGTTYEFDDFTIVLPELADATFEDKADGAYLFYGAANFMTGVPAVMQCVWKEAAPALTAEETLAAMDASVGEQGFGLVSSAILRDEEIEIGGKAAHLAVYEQVLKVPMGFANIEMTTQTGEITVQSEDGGAFVFTVSASDAVTLEAGLTAVQSVIWK